MENANLMQSFFEIKGRNIGGGRPLVCVPVVERTEEAIIRKFRTLVRKSVSMIEWRADYFDGLGQPGRVRSVLEEIRPFLGDKILLFTVRSEEQGGNACLAEDELLYLDEVAAKSGVADLADLEFFELARPQRAIRRLQRMGVRVIASHHDFSGTPDDWVLKMLLDQMRESGADIAKLAVMPESGADTYRLMDVARDMREKHPGCPLVAIAMGEEGLMTRVGAEGIGSCITFASDGEASAPGQIPLDDLNNLLDTMHKFTMRKGK